MKLSKQRKTALAALLFVTVFIFRLGFGLSSDFWTEDEKQIYLIGLKFYATGAWPYFGPDVTNTIQIPGALQGLIVGGPLLLLPIPEAPYVLLNLLSLAALSFLAWYSCKRLRQVPGWFIWAWLLTAPWTLNVSTHVYLTLGTLCILYISFLFSIKEPHSHTFYLVFPIAMLYSLYCWSPFLHRKGWRRFAVVFLLCGIVFSAGLGFHNLRRKSLYLDREIPAAAIGSRDHTILGTRREGARY